jgi:uncharacterized protein
MNAEPDRPEPDADHRLVDAVKNADLATLERLLAEGVAVDARDDDDWRALDWAAGRGDVAAIGLLLGAGADVHATGTEQRTPYQIALAAGHLEALEILAAAEDRDDPHAVNDRHWQPYCRAYQVSDLRRFPYWPDSDDASDVLFLHHDLTVTRGMWRGEDVVFDDVTDEWRRFCAAELAFRVPRDVDLVPGH